MNTKTLLLATTLLCSAVTPALYAGPTVYLRGDVSGRWGVSDTYRFTEQSEGVYTLHVESLYGEFKVATSDWSTVDYGSKEQSCDVAAGGNFVMTRSGRNFSCATTLHNVYLRFVNRDGADTYLEIAADGAPLPAVPPPAPDETTGMLSGTLPVLYINVYTDESHSTLNNEIISTNLAHKDYFSFADYWLDMNGCTWLEEEGGKSIGSEDKPLPLEIKARGNWTRVGFAKKPFKIKLGKKQKMLGMSNSKHFALLAHADDNYGYLRNFTGFNLGRRIGLPWTPWQQPVELVINGNYRGLYFLTESIRIDDDRVSISELDDNVSDPVLVSGGYIVELDNYDEDNQIRMEEKIAAGSGISYADRLRITFDTPEEYSDIQRQFVADQFSAINDAIGANSDDTWKHVDLDDAARYYLVEEIVSHTEAYHGSTYLFRDRGEGCKWHFSPLWDFGNAFNGPTDDFFYRHAPFGSTWIPSLRVNSTFNDKVSRTWMWFMSSCYEGLEDDIAVYAGRIAAAAKADRRRWKNEPKPDGGASVADNSDMEGRKNAVLSHLHDKLSFLRSRFGDYTALSAPVAEPERDTTPAAPLPDYIGAGVDNVAVDSDAPAEYYDLTGIRISRPAPGSIVIERRGSAVRKIRF